MSATIHNQEYREIFLYFNHSLLFLMKDVISMRNWLREEVDSLITSALDLKRKKNDCSGMFRGKKLASLFYENSTRTRESFEQAAVNLGMSVVGFSGIEGTSVKKGETIVDTIRMYSGYGADLFVMRHNLDGAPQAAADVLDVPVINGGDGCNGHPTQTMLDLMTIKEAHGTVDGLKIAMVGDLRYGRTVHSLLQAAEQYEFEPWLVAPEIVAMPTWRVEDFRKATGRDIIVTDDLAEVIRTVDVLYMTRIQRERFPESPEGQAEYQKISGKYRLTAEMLKDAKSRLIVLHPLPRYKYDCEIDVGVDKTSHAKYFVEAENGLYLRQALLARCLDAEFRERKTATLAHQDLWLDQEIKEQRKEPHHFLYRITNGTLIDHIEAGKGMAVTRVLGLNEYYDTPLIVARNLCSERYGRKDVVGVQNRELTDGELNILGLVSSGATVNIIRDGRVVRKGKVNLPDTLENVIQCLHSGCVSAPEHYEHIPARFYVEERETFLVR